jgi:hypothetical protein
MSLTFGSQRERQWENGEYKRIKRFSHMAAVESAVQENEDRDRQDMKTRLEVWDDDESDELFYVDRYVQLRFTPLNMPSSAFSQSGMAKKTTTHPCS